MSAFRPAVLVILIPALLLPVSVAVHGEQKTVLPRPRAAGPVSVEEAIRARESVRRFADQPLSLAEVSQLLWAGAGRRADTVSAASRSFPSAGGLYPVELFLVAGAVRDLAAGVYRYDWAAHTLERVEHGDRRRQLAEAALAQRWMAGAPITLVLGVVEERTSRRYGERGVRRYVPLDAGHAAQNIQLQAAALGLGTTAVGAFDDRGVAGVVGLEGVQPLLLIPAGRPLR